MTLGGEKPNAVFVTLVRYILKLYRLGVKGRPRVINYAKSSFTHFAPVIHFISEQTQASLYHVRHSMVDAWSKK